MSLRRSLSRAPLAGAHASRRLSHGLLFLAGGLLRIADYKRAASSYFEDFLDQPPEILEGLNPLEARMYQRAVRPGARVCVIGCGSGRDLLPFVAAGHQVVGVEPAPGPIAMLKRLLEERGGSAEVIQGFAEDVALPGMFDAFIFSPHCYCYIPGSARRVAVLQKLKEHLNPDGRIAINFLRRTGPWSLVGMRIASATARLTGSDCPWEPHDVVQLQESARRRAILFEHYFLPEEVHAEAGRAGLRLIDSEVDSFLGPISIVGR